MKVGDRVRVVGLANADHEETNLEIGSVGVVTKESESEYTPVSVDFGKGFLVEQNSGNMTHAGYYMFVGQLEKIEEDKQ